MPYEVKIIADSISPAGARITTMQLRMPRYMLAQFNTHRAFSRNARSSRAVPVERIIAEIESDPCDPIFWGANRKGMQATEGIGEDREHNARLIWGKARQSAVGYARWLADQGVHKQIVNRLLEPFMWVDVVVTSTEWANYFALRCHRHAQGEHQKPAVMMARAYRESEPRRLKKGEWHLPYLTEEEWWSHGHMMATLTVDEVIKFSTARCCRVSYKAHDGTAPDPEKDIELHDQLISEGHWSPTEHPALCIDDPEERSGNLTGWRQYRQMFPRNVHREFDFGVLDRDYADRDFIV